MTDKTNRELFSENYERVTGQFLNHNEKQYLVVWDNNRIHPIYCGFGENDVMWKDMHYTPYHFFLRTERHFETRNIQPVLKTIDHPALFTQKELGTNLYIRYLDRQVSQPNPPVSGVLPATKEEQVILDQYWNWFVTGRIMFSNLVYAIEYMYFKMNGKMFKFSIDPFTRKITSKFLNPADDLLACDIVKVFTNAELRESVMRGAFPGSYENEEESFMYGPYFATKGN